MARFTELVNGLYIQRKISGCYNDMNGKGDYTTGRSVDRLAELEDKLESGQLVELPCKVGDLIYIVYLDDDYEYKIAKTECIGFNIRRGDIDIITDLCCYDPFRYGKFTTKEAADARLKELQEKGQ